MLKYITHTHTHTNEIHYTVHVTHFAAENDLKAVPFRAEKPEDYRLK